MMKSCYVNGLLLPFAPLQFTSGAEVTAKTGIAIEAAHGVSSQDLAEEDL